ncbi:MAG: outer membrane protein transport protein [Bacteroidota bacterium]
MKRIVVLLIFLCLSSLAKGQDGLLPITYNSLALQFNSRGFNGDAQAAVIPSIASYNGFGGVFDNPASASLAKNSEFSFGTIYNNTEQDNAYLGNTINSSAGLLRPANIGIVYKAPTTRGSFVLGGGYNRTLQENRNNAFQGFNTNSSITDTYKFGDNDFFDPAFNAFATEDLELTDGSIIRESIFRLFDDLGSDFMGITQDATRSQITAVNNYNAFIATEFQRGFHLGISLGVLDGNSEYDQLFSEIDANNAYAGDFIAIEGSATGTDIDRIAARELLNSDFVAFSANFGVIVEALPFLNLGVSYTLPSYYLVEERYSAEVVTQFDDPSVFPAEGFLGSEFEYGIRQPGILSFGGSLINMDNVSISASAELIDYTTTEFDLTRENNLDALDESTLRNDELVLEQFVQDNYNQVVNLRLGGEYKLSDYVQLRAGYAFFPARTKEFDSDRTQLSFGFGTMVGEGIALDVAAQYSFWDDRSVIYRFDDPFVSSTPVSAEVSEEIRALNVLATLKFFF